RVEVLSSLSLVNAAGDHVKEMRNHARGDEQLPFRVVINAPGVAETMGDDFEHILGRVIAPDAPIDLNALNALGAGVRWRILGKRIVAIVEPPFAHRFSDLRR